MYCYLQDRLPTSEILKLECQINTDFSSDSNCPDGLIVLIKSCPYHLAADGLVPERIHVLVVVLSQ